MPWYHYTASSQQPHLLHLLYSNVFFYPFFNFQLLFCEARRASHWHSPQTTYSSKLTCCVLSAQKSAMHVVVYADRLTALDCGYYRLIMKLLANLISQLTCRMLLACSLAAHRISSASHTSVLPQHPRRKITPFRVGWNHHTIDYYG